jgi:hypothetical protein
MPAYRWLPLIHNLGVSQEFTWHFEAADVTHPLIGAQFLSRFSLDEVTS